MRAREWEEAVKKEIDWLEDSITNLRVMHDRKVSEMQSTLEGMIDSREVCAARLRSLLEAGTGEEEAGEG